MEARINLILLELVYNAWALFFRVKIILYNENKYLISRRIKL
nr:MAG TPA_asm: hypothetical protein [Bacteriophage sp.]